MLSGSRQNSIDSLTGIRALAAVWVVIYHFKSDITQLFSWFEWASSFARAGFLGVDLFFILSGFIITYNYLNEFQAIKARSYVNFLWLRLARLYPVHLFTLCCLAVIVAGAQYRGITLNNAHIFTVEGFLKNILLVHAWGTSQVSWNFVAWSISAEWFAYLTFPFVAISLARVRSPRAALLGATGALAMMPLLNALMQPLPLTRGLQVGWLVQVSSEFLAGCFLCLLYRSGWAAGWRWSAIAPATLFVAATLSALLVAMGAAAVWMAPILGFFVLAVARAGGPFARWLGSRHMVYCGQVSYALYMTHGIVQMLLAKLLPPTAFADSSAIMRLAVLAVYGLLVFGGAALTYAVVEKPARERLRQVGPCGIRWRRQSELSPSQALP
jgi:peptidoglycan/LPS O-acetylase OafA/YrhL